jgi:putative ABC transport system permease protein
MLFFTVIVSALKSLLANKMRSFLAMLGIIIGVGAVIAMLAMGAGAQQQITQRFTSMGTNLLFIRPAQKATGGGGARTGSFETLVLEDALAIARLPGVDAVSPVVNGQVQAKYMNQNMRSQINGVSMPYFGMRNFEIDKGRMFTEGESENMARVVVIGPNVATNLFGTMMPVGETIKLNNLSFTVVGVLKSKGDTGFNSPDDQCLVPYSTAMKIMFGQDYLREIDVAVADGADQSAVSGQPAQTGFGGGGGGGGGPGGRGGRNGTVHTTPPPPESITSALRKRHRLNDLSTPDDFTIQNQAELLQNLSESLMTFRILLGGIAAISLLVGGIGIMNIMLVTVTERTREIGTRKAIGAKNSDILLQFLIEAMVMAGLGGALGAGLGIGLAKGITLIPIFSSFLTVVEPVVVVTSITVAALVGLASGLYPAFRASMLDPIDALRYE